MIYQPAPDKQCTKCKAWHSRNEFNIRRASRDGLAPICRSCDSARSRKYNAEHKEQMSDYNRNRRPKSDELKQKKKLYQASHREQHREACRRYRANHPDKMREDTRRARAKNPELHRTFTRKRRARRRGLPDAFTDQDWQRAVDTFGGRCAYCGSQPGLIPALKLCADHWIPLDSPDCPGTVPTNILPACKSCNSQKNKADPLEWLTRKLGKRNGAIKLREIEAYFETVKQR